MEVKDSSGLRVDYLAPIIITKAVTRTSGFALEDTVRGFFIKVVEDPTTKNVIAVKYAERVVDGKPVDERLAYVSSLDYLHLDTARILDSML